MSEVERAGTGAMAMGGRARSQLLIVAAEVVIVDLAPGYKERDFSDEEEISAAPEQYQVAGA